MDLKSLKDTPPWEWPEDAAKVFLGVLRDKEANDSQRFTAAELAGDLVAINDNLVDELLSIVRNGEEPEKLRGMAAISLGPVLEYADTEDFEDPDDVPITEQTFHRIHEVLRKLYTDADVPKEVRRRILEASVRSPHGWHRDAIRAAYFSEDEDWRLTAVFSMRFVRGFDDQILEALESANPEIHYNAVCAAGGWGLDDAWSHIARIVDSKGMDKDLLIAAIEAAAEIRPQEAGVILVDLTGSDDEDIVEAVDEAMAMAEMPAEHEGLDDDEDVDSI